MRLLDLFSGIGGFSLGLERAGFQTVAFCEIDPFCRAVLRKHWPDVPCYDDVTTLTAARLAADGIITANNGRPMAYANIGREHSSEQICSGRQEPRSFSGIDAICGGFPCQDISLAGAGAGIEGSRSGLWSEYARLIDELRPKYVIVENVAALLNRGMERVLGDLASIRYDAEWHCIPACAVGAPHRRDRVWIIAYPKCIPGGEQSGIDLQWGRSSEAQQIRLGGGDVANSECGRLPSGNVECAWPPTIIPPAFGRHCRGPEFGQTWRAEPNVGGGIDGFPAWLDRCIGRGLSHAESGRRTKVLRDLWSPHVSQALRRAAGGLERIQQAEVLFAFVREYEIGINEARLLVAGKKASEIFLRSLRILSQIRSAPHRSGSKKQRPAKHSDLVQPLSRLLAHDGEAHWAGDGWENAVPRIAKGVPLAMDRLRSLGNAIVPQIAEIIGRAILQ
jgi:DNA (cytosine-5)-methyltransferase 1